MKPKAPEFLKEAGIVSLTRVIIVVGYMAFLLATAYLILHGMRWDHYETFATLTGGGSGAFQIMNKFINSKYNTSSEECGKPLGDNYG